MPLPNQPTQLQPPISGQDPAQVFGPPTPPPPAYPNPQPNASPAPAPDPFGALGPAAPAPAEDMFAALGPAPAGANPEFQPVSPSPEDANVFDRPSALTGGFKGYLQNLRDRWDAGMGRNPQESVAILQTKYGKQNVKLANGGKEIAVRQPNGKFMTLDGDQVGFWADLIGDIADASGGLYQGAHSAVAEIPGVAAAAAAAPETGGGSLLAIPPILAAAGMHGANARDSAVRAYGITPTANLTEEQIAGAAANVVGYGVGAALKNTLQGAAKFVQNARLTSPEERIRQLGVVRSTLDEIATRYFPRGARVTADQTDASIRSATERLSSELGSQVGAKRGQVLRMAGEEGRFSAQQTIDELRDILRPYVSFERDGTAKLSGEVGAGVDYTMRPPTVVDTGILNERGQPISRIAKLNWQEVPVPGQPVREPINPGGMNEGPKLFEKLTEDYNRLLTEQAQGGVKAQELFDTTSYYQENGHFHQLHGDRATQIAKRVGYASAADRNQMAMQVLGGDPEGAEYKAFEAAYKNHSEKIDYLRDMETMLSKQENAPVISEAIIRPKKAEDIRKFKQMYGAGTSDLAGTDQSPWGNVRSYWINKLFEDHVDPSTGILNTRKLLETLNKYGDDVLSEVFRPAEKGKLGELGQIRQLALKANKIQVNDLMTPEQYAGFIKDLVQSPVFRGLMPKARALIAWTLSKPRPMAADYLVEEGWRDVAKMPELERPAWEQMVSNYRSMYELARRRKVNGREIFMDAPRAVTPGAVGQAAVGATVRGAAAGAAANAVTPDADPETAAAIQGMAQ